MDVSLSRAVLARALKTGLSFPRPVTLERFRSEESQRALLGAAGALDPSGLLVEAVRNCCSRSHASSSELERSYNRIFGHSLRGRVCPYETEYGPLHVFQRAHRISDIAGFYLAFGLAPKKTDSERADHVAYELEFLEFLSLKEAHALTNGDTKMYGVTRAALKRFLSEHLGRFGRAFGSSLLREDPEGFYGALGNLCEKFLRSECEREGVPVGPEFLELSPAEEDDVPMACGDGSEAMSPERAAAFEV